MPTLEVTFVKQSVGAGRAEFNRKTPVVPLPWEYVSPNVPGNMQLQSKKRRSVQTCR
jgi:hypothetical protein